MASIRRDLKSKKWIVDFYVGRVRKRLAFNVRHEAEAFKRDLLLRPLDQKLGISRIVQATLKEAIEKYLSLVSSSKAQETAKLESGYFDIMSSYFCRNKNFDGMISTLNLIDLQEFQVHLRKTLKASTVNRHFNTYRHFFKQCKKWGYIETDPTEGLERLKESQKPIKIWHPDEVLNVLRELEPWMVQIVFFIAKTGVRRSEARKLKTEDVDLQRRIVNVKSWKGGECRIREIPLTDGLFEVLQKQVVLAKANKWSHVFVDGNGLAIGQTILSTRMHRAAIRAGHPGMNLHSLRHTILTQLAKSNESLRKIQLLAGHASLKTTQRYLQNDTEDVRQSLERHENIVRIDIFKAAKGSERKENVH